MKEWCPAHPLRACAGGDGDVAQSTLVPFVCRACGRAGVDDLALAVPSVLHHRIIVSPNPITGGPPVHSISALGHARLAPKSLLRRIGACLREAARTKWDCGTPSD